MAEVSITCSSISLDVVIGADVEPLCAVGRQRSRELVRSDLVQRRKYL
jgi:hypothetical protein